MDRGSASILSAICIKLSWRSLHGRNPRYNKGEPDSGSNHIGFRCVKNP